MLGAEWDEQFQMMESEAVQGGAVVGLQAAHPVPGLEVSQSSSRCAGAFSVIQSLSWRFLSHPIRELEVSQSSNP